MSMSLMVKAMKAEVGNPLRKLVLIKLADNANDKGECWPSYQHIADQCEISRSSAKTHIKALEDAGFLMKSSRSDGRSSNRYKLTIEKGSPAQDRSQKVTRSGDNPVNAQPGQEMTPGGSGDDRGGGSGADPRTSHSSEPVKNQKGARKSAAPSPVTIDTYMDRCKQAGDKVIPEGDAVFEYAERVGLPIEFVRLAYREFVERSRANGKKYKDWRQAFQNCVRDNWYRLWYADSNGEFQLGTNGVQARKADEAGRKEAA